MKNPLSPAFWRESLREAVRAARSLLNRDLSPERAARSVAVGLFIGASPFFGFHFFICAGLAYLLRLDLFVTYVATNISIAPVIPFLVFLELQIGNRLLQGHWLSLRMEDFDLSLAQEMGGSLLAGASIVGSGLALVGGSLTWLLIRSLKGRKTASAKDALGSAIDEVRALYKGVPPAHRHYVSTKLRMDPLTGELYRLVQQEGSMGRLVDAACGRGQYSLFLAKLGAVESLVGFDHDLSKVKAAQSAASGIPELEAKFSVGDLRDAEVPLSDTILLLDVLHYLSVQEQSEVLERFCASLAPGGRLIVRETNDKGGLGSLFARIFEHMAKIFRVNRGEHLAFREPGLLEKELEARGLAVACHAPKGALSNVLLVARLPMNREDQLADRQD